MLAGCFSDEVLVTGASGFVGQAVWERLRAEGVPVRGIVRDEAKAQQFPRMIVGPALTAQSDWRDLLKGCQAVIHAAARVHVIREAVTDPLAAFRAVNVEGALTLAKQAAEVGVKRFIFISTIKVNGETSLPGRPFRADDMPAPCSPYGISKAEAEEQLCVLAAQSGMEVSIIRAPLVYGPGVKGNFQTMIRWLKKGVPLPLEAVHNRRTFVALDNLVDLIFQCLWHPNAANQTFLAGDAESVATPDLLRRLAVALGVPVRLFPVPLLGLKMGAYLFGQRLLIERLCDDLQVDISKAIHLLGWRPPLTLDEGLNCFRPALANSDILND